MLYINDDMVCYHLSNWKIYHSTKVKWKKLNSSAIMRGSHWLVSWDPVLTSGQRFDFYTWRSFCHNPLRLGMNCVLPRLLEWDFKLKVLCLFIHYTEMTEYTYFPSHSLKKSRPLKSVMMDDNAPTHERSKIVKSYKICSIKQEFWQPKNVGMTY